MHLSPATVAQVASLAAGALLVTSVLLVWRRSLRPAVRLLAVQGAALALLVAATGLAAGEAELLAVALVVLALKGVVVPWVLERGVRTGGPDREDAPRLNPTAGLVAVAGLTTVAYLVSRPITAVLVGPAAAGHASRTVLAVPIGLVLVLVGLLLMTTRRRAVSQLVGFVVLDNGIAAVAFLTAAGVPLLVELGVSFELLLIVLILAVLTGRIRGVAGPLALDTMTELRD